MTEDEKQPEDEDLREKARDMFTQSKEDALSDYLERMEGWFQITDGDIDLDDSILSLDQGSQYLAYLLAAYIGEFIDERDSLYVSHGEANDYFGWGSGRTAAEYASDNSDLLNTENGEKAIARAQLGSVVERIEEKLGQ